MLDKDRILVKIDEMDGYLKDLNKITPRDFAVYQKVEIKRSSERLIQLSVECVIDICRQLVKGLSLGLPAGENDTYTKLLKEGIITEETASLLQNMQGFRNILVHEYGVVDDELVFEIISTRLKDFQVFKEEILSYLRN